MNGVEVIVASSLAQYKIGLAMVVVSILLLLAIGLARGMDRPVPNWSMGAVVGLAVGMFAFGTAFDTAKNRTYDAVERHYGVTNLGRPYYGGYRSSDQGESRTDKVTGEDTYEVTFRDAEGEEVHGSLLFVDSTVTLRGNEAIEWERQQR